MFKPSLFFVFATLIVHFGFTQDKPRFDNARNAQKSTDESVLSEGSWLKLRVNSSGVYKVTHGQLASNGLLSGSVPSSKLGVFGQGAYTFPHAAGTMPHDDLYENAIAVYDGGDGSFDSGDFLLFYGQGPHNITLSGEQLKRERNPFSTASFYFVTADHEAGKRIQDYELGNGVIPSVEQATHTYLNIYEQELVNIGKTGRRMFGEAFEFVTNRTFSVSTVKPAAGEQPQVMVTGAIASKGGTSAVTVDVDGQQRTSQSSGLGTYEAGRDLIQLFTVDKPNGGNISVKIDFQKGSSSAKAWLDYIKVQTITNENIGSGVYHLPASNADAVALTTFINDERNYWLVGRYGAEGALSVKNWNGKSALFLDGGELQHIVEFDPESAPSPGFLGGVPNQNLHGISGVDYIIVYPKLFERQANELAEFHSQHGLDVITVEDKLIYDEFSSGAKHVVGIRDFFKHVYDKDPGKLKYALLFGDASYINLDGFEGNTALLPSYQSANSLSDLGNGGSYVTDDFFGFLEYGEGELETNNTSGFTRIPRSDMDIAIGRMPVHTVAQAQAMVEKVKRYMNGPSKERFGAWRNVMMFVADDFDGNFGPTEENHTTEANELASWIEETEPSFQVKKVFSDAYKQESTPGGSRYPEVNRIIRERVQNGALLVNYSGHGGEVGWAHERILDLSTINGWTNQYKMPIMVTATCEFSRFDDPDRISAGEYCLLNPNGGAIALLSTTRVVYSSPNFALNTDFIQNLYSEREGNVRIGDVYKATMQQYMQNPRSPEFNHLNFTLLGDPAVKIAFPENHVQTERINGQDFATYTDTIKALSLVTIEGAVKNQEGNTLSDFNGEVEVKIYDKATTQKTLNNDNGNGGGVTFKARNSIIYQGVASVTNGEFQVQFIVPKDIQFKEGNGLLQYYASSETTDANGGTEEIMVGGINPNPIADDRGPQIDLFLNDETFISGETTGENPNLIAYLSDESGINITGAGIGHDMLAYIDGDVRNAAILNTYYRADLDSYQSGRLEYPFEGIPSGEHTLTVRAWDNNNNPGEATINFLVRDADEPFLEELMAYPNPAVNNTTIRFTHNQGGYASEAVLEIIDVQGRVVARNVWNLDAQQKGTATYDWDLKNNSSTTINAGTYVYRVTLNSESGETAVATNRLLVVR